jgi:serine/threonine-protein kinase
MSDSQEVLVPDSKLREGRFTVTKKLISGGQANIYLGKDIDNKTVVLKEFQLIPAESLDSLIESASTFEGESTILSQLNHPGIVKLYDLFIEGSRVYLALEHIEGLTLRELARESGLLDEQTVLDLAKQMCDILNYLHSHVPSIVHRDFTPDNLIRQPDGKLKLIDFSVAQEQKSESRNCAGKHAYTPPEQFRGEACAQSDIYALGATLYFLLTGKDPEPISTSSVKEKRTIVSDRLNTIIERCTALDLEDRYESIAWLKTELMSINAGNQTTQEMSSLINLVASKAATSSLDAKNITKAAIDEMSSSIAACEPIYIHKSVPKKVKK